MLLVVALESYRLYLNFIHTCTAMDAISSEVTMVVASLTATTVTEFPMFCS